MLRMKLILILSFICPLMAVQAEMPEKFKVLIKQTGLQEGEYKSITKAGKNCFDLELRFFAPENSRVTILNGARPLFENLGQTSTDVDRKCKRTVISKVEPNKIAQTIVVNCEDKNKYTFLTSSEIKEDVLHIMSIVKDGEKVTETSACQYNYVAGP